MSLHRLIFVSFALFAAASVSLAARVVTSASSLPTIFFHGVTANAQAGTFLRQNLETPTRPFLALSFCQDACSASALPAQVDLAIAQIRSLTANDSRFASGYNVIAHSQGGVLARAVIEAMDDHKVHTFISLAGAQNGNFYGPQATDHIPTQVFIKSLGPKVLPATVFDFSNYTDAQVASGALQLDFIKLVNAQPALQQQLSMANLLRSPVEADWMRVNKFLPVINNRASTADATRRKRNFVRLHAAHFFASPADDLISPWQTSILGQYEDVSSMTALAAKYATLNVIPMTSTREYTADTYGLKTLDKRGALFLHTVAGVGHNCWLHDATPAGSATLCAFQPVFDAHLAPLLLEPSRAYDAGVVREPEY